MSTEARQEKDFQTQANEYANCSLESIREMLDAVTHAQECTGEIKCTEEYHDEDDARQRIDEDPLEIQVRSDWHNLGDEDANKPTEYYILITTGGPAARIIGELDSYGQPESARFEYQDWFKPWTPAETTSEQDSTMLEYAQHFYFGE